MSNVRTLSRQEETEIYMLATQAKATAADIKQYYGNLNPGDMRFDITRLASSVDQLADAIRKLVI